MFEKFPGSIRGLVAWMGLLVSFGVCGNARAANPTEFDQANQLYDQSKFAEASRGYEALVQTGNHSANLFYNLGNAQYRLGQTAAAMLAYERALALQPGHSEARANLALLRQESGAKPERGRWWDHGFPELAEDSFVLLATVGAWLCVFAVTAIFIRRGKANGGFWFAASASLIVALYAGAATLMAETKNAASIVVEKNAEARLAPADGAPAVQTLPIGSRVRVLSERGLWNYCILPNDERGWIPAKMLDRIRMAAS